MAKDKNSGFRLMGFGHRVYKNFDPRAKILKDAADEVLAKLGINDPLLDIAKELEEVALNDEYFVERKLYPNVDFYSGIIYRAHGHPDEHVHGDVRPRPPARLDRALEGDAATIPRRRIGRPRQIYTGATQRPYVPLDKR